MTKLVKKAWIGLYVNLVLLILIIVSLALYGSNVATQGYFYGTGNAAVYVTTAFALVFALITIALPVVSHLFKLDKIIIVRTVLDVVNDVLRVLIPILLVIAFVVFISDRVEGLAYIYGSNEDVLQEVQTDANLASASGAIKGLIFYAITFVIAIAGCFFPILRTTTEETETEKA